MYETFCNFEHKKAVRTVFFNHTSHDHSLTVHFISTKMTLLLLSFFLLIL